MYSALFFSYFSLLCAAVNFDFILILINFDSILCNSNSDFILYYNLLLRFYSTGDACTFDMCY